MTRPDSPVVTGWRKSSFSGSSGCVELGRTDDGRIAVRNSRAPESGFVLFTRHEIDVFLQGVVAGEFDEFR